MTTRSTRSTSKPQPTVAKPAVASRAEKPSDTDTVETPSAADVAALAERMRTPKAADALLFGYVYSHGAPKPKHLASFDKIFKGAIELGHTQWPTQLRGLVSGKDVLDFGCGNTLYGPAFRAMGARSYTGIDKAINPLRKRFRSRALKQTVSLNFSLSDVARVIPNVSYMVADDVVSRSAFDVVLMQSVSDAVTDLDSLLKNLARALRPGGQIWMLHENYYAWAGHQQAPSNPSRFDEGDEQHRRLADWNHVTYQPEADDPMNGRFNRIRLPELRTLLDQYFEVDVWKEIEDRTSIVSRLTPEIKARLAGFEDRELLSKQVIVQARKR